MTFPCFISSSSLKCEHFSGDFCSYLSYDKLMKADGLFAWMELHAFNKTKAASELGIARNTLDAYLAGKHPIPRYIALACAAIAIGLRPHP